MKNLLVLLSIDSNDTSTLARVMSTQCGFSQIVRGEKIPQELDNICLVDPTAEQIESVIENKETRFLIISLFHTSKVNLPKKPLWWDMVFRNPGEGGEGSKENPNVKYLEFDLNELSLSEIEKELVELKLVLPNYVQVLLEG